MKRAEEQMKSVAIDARLETALASSPVHGPCYLCIPLAGRTDEEPTGEVRERENCREEQ